MKLHVTWKKNIIYHSSTYYVQVKKNSPVQVSRLLYKCKLPVKSRADSEISGTPSLSWEPVHIKYFGILLWKKEIFQAKQN